MKKYVGIDYSMNSPAITISGDHFVDVYYVPQKASQELISPFSIGRFRFHSSSLRKGLRGNDRIENNMQMVLSVLDDQESTEIFIEGYSYGSEGTVFDIAENCGVLKHELWKKGYRFTEFAPSAIKKFATGKGNSKKDAMYDAFFKKEAVDLCGWLNTTSDSNPVSDIVDSFFISEYGRTAK